MINSIIKHVLVGSYPDVIKRVALRIFIKVNYGLFMKLYIFVNAWAHPVANDNYAGDGIRANTYSGWYVK